MMNFLELARKKVLTLRHNLKQHVELVVVEIETETSDDIYIFYFTDGKGQRARLRTFLQKWAEHPELNLGWKNANRIGAEIEKSLAKRPKREKLKELGNPANRFNHRPPPPHKPPTWEDNLGGSPPSP